MLLMMLDWCALLLCGCFTCYLVCVGELVGVVRVVVFYVFLSVVDSCSDGSVITESTVV